MRATPFLISALATTVSALLVGPAVTPRGVVKMQYGGQQQGYGQQQAYGGQQQGFGGQQQYAPGTWHIFPRDGAASQLKTTYDVAPGMQQVLGRWDVDPCGKYQTPIPADQCTVQVGQDGSLTIWATGAEPIGVRSSPNEPWYWMQNGQSQVMQHGWKVSLDYRDSEAAVFKFEMAGQDGLWQQTYGQQGYGQQQGQQGGYY